MPLVNYENDSSDGEEDVEQSASLLANLPKPHESSTTTKTNPFTTMDFPEDELEDIVRVENKAYAKDLPQAPKPIKRKRDGPVKIFLPTVEQVRRANDRPVEVHFFTL